MLPLSGCCRLMASWQFSMNRHIFQRFRGHHFRTGRHSIPLKALAPLEKGLILVSTFDRTVNAMDAKIITVENRQGTPRIILQRVLRMVPDRDKQDKRLQRLLAFRVRHDGEAATCEYLMRHIRRYVRHPDPRSFYEFLLKGQGDSGIEGRPRDPDPPGAA